MAEGMLVDRDSNSGSVTRRRERRGGELALLRLVLLSCHRDCR
jgi:hypothetical protein